MQQNEWKLVKTDIIYNQKKNIIPFVTFALNSTSQR